MVLRQKRRKRRLGLRIAGLLKDARDPDALSTEQKDKLLLWRSDPWAFLTGTDVRQTATPDFPRGRPIIWTKDERDTKLPVKPFPADLGYLREYIVDLHTLRRLPRDYRFSTHEAVKVAVEKSRQMIISTGTLLYGYWDCATTAARRWIVSKVTEDESKDLVREKVRYPYSQMPAWVQREFPILPRPAEEVRFPKTDSLIRCAAQNMAVRQARGVTASVLFLDEATLQDELHRILGAATPMVPLIIMVGTPQLGGPGSGAHEFRQHTLMWEDPDPAGGLVSL